MMSPTLTWKFCDLSQTSPTICHPDQLGECSHFNLDQGCLSPLELGSQRRSPEVDGRVFPQVFPPLPCLSRHPLPTHDWRFRVGLGSGCLFHTQLPGLSQILTSLTPWTGLSFKLSFFVYNTFFIFPLRGRCVWTLLGQYHSNYLHTSSRELVFRFSHAPLEWVCSHVSSALRRVLNSKNCWNDLKRPLCDN